MAIKRLVTGKVFILQISRTRRVLSSNLINDHQVDFWFGQSRLTLVPTKIHKYLLNHKPGAVLFHLQRCIWKSHGKLDWQFFYRFEIWQAFPQTYYLPNYSTILIHKYPIFQVITGWISQVVLNWCRQSPTTANHMPSKCFATWQVPSLAGHYEYPHIAFLALDVRFLHSTEQSRVPFVNMD